MGADSSYPLSYVASLLHVSVLVVHFVQSVCSAYLLRAIAVLDLPLSDLAHRVQLDSALLSHALVPADSLAFLSNLGKGNQLEVARAGAVDLYRKDRLG